MRILVIHGPNLNLLGRREPEIYGRESLEEINEMLRRKAEELGVELRIIQSNHEGEIVTAIGEAMDWADGIIINPAAYTHTSVAIRDALAAAGLPAIEVHISNIFKREPFRHHSYISPVVDGVITGLGGYGYVLALEALVRRLSDKT